MALAGKYGNSSRGIRRRPTIGVVFHISSFLGDGVSGGVATFIVDDLDGLHAELAGRQVAIDVEPTDQNWDNREMYVRDPDGNSVRFVQGTGN